MPEKQITITAQQQEDLRLAFDQIQPMGAVDQFCKLWPDAKTALDMLRNLLALIPGVSLFAATAITIVITAGDATHSSRLCKKT